MMKDAKKLQKRGVWSNGVHFITAPITWGLGVTGTKWTPGDAVAGHLLSRFHVIHCILRVTVAYWIILVTIEIALRCPPQSLQAFQELISTWCPKPQRATLRCLPSPWGILWPSFLGPSPHNRKGHQSPWKSTRKVLAFNAMWNLKA